MFDLITQYSDKFQYKTAGILKMPEELLSQAIIWAKGAYCWNLDQELISFINIAKQREMETEKFSILSDIWTSGLGYINEAIKTGNINPFIEWVGQGKTLPVIKSEKQQGLKGVVDYITPTIYLGCELNSPPGYTEKYDFLLKINLPGGEHQPPFKHYEYSPPNIGFTKIQVLAELKRNYTLIKTIVQNFINHSQYDYDTYDPDYLKRIKFIRALCQKYIRDADINDEHDAKYNTLNFIAEQLPYFRENSLLKNQKLALNLTFIPTETEAKTIYNEEDWLGLFSGHIIPGASRNKVYLGSIYLARDISKHFKKLLNDPEQLNDFLSDIARTISHEMKHFIQLVLQRSYIPDVGPYDYWEGLPSRKLRDPLFNPHGYKLPTWEGKPIDEKAPRLPHAERDVEFYTRLGDNVSFFEESKKKLPKAAHLLYARAWTGEIAKEDFEKQAAYAIRPFFLQSAEKADGKEFWEFMRPIKKEWDKTLGFKNDFFLNLKREQPLKWQKAVKEFWKAID